MNGFFWSGLTVFAAVVAAAWAISPWALLGLVFLVIMVWLHPKDSGG